MQFSELQERTEEVKEIKQEEPPAPKEQIVKPKVIAAAQAEKGAPRKAQVATRKVSECVAAWSPVLI
jgi:DNA-binding protein H-NS